MKTFTVEELQERYKPTSLDDIDFSSEVTSTTMEQLRSLADVPTREIKESVAGGGRNCRNFEISRWEAYRLKETPDWSYEGVLEICKRHAGDLPLCEVIATARKMFSWINENHKEGLRGHKYISKPHWADLRWTYYRRDVGETLSDFAFRVGISYSMAKKHSREKKLYRHEGRWFFVSNSVIEPVVMSSQAGKAISTPAHYDIYMDTSNSVDDDLRREFAELSCMELERPPPRPSPKVLTTITATQSAKLWDTL